MAAGEYTTYDRVTLYEEVWAEPVRTVARRYGVSDVALAKTCRRLCVPLPGRGYWAKRRAGKAPKRPPLPDSDGPERIVSDRTPIVELALTEHDRVEVPEVIVADALRRPHALVAAAREDMKQGPFYNRLSSCRLRSHLDITVSGDSVKRALRIMDALIKHLEKAGIPVRVAREAVYRYGSTDDRNWATQAQCSGEWVGFALRERQFQAKDPPPSWATPGSLYDRPTTSLHPSGDLELSLTSYRLPGLRKVWSDGKRQHLEDRLGEFVVGLYAAGARLKEVHEADRRREEELEEARRRREEEVERRRREQERAERLLSWVRQWRQARDLRSFANEALAALGEREVEVEPGVPLRGELLWALEYADRIDPLVSE